MPASSVEEKIRALLRLANDSGASEHEASLAMERAHALLLKHNLDIATIELGEDSEAEQVVDEAFGKNYSQKWRRVLAGAIAKHNYCHTFRYTSRDGVVVFRIVGRPHNVVATREMAIWLMGQVADMTVERWGIENNVLHQTDGSTETEWKDGFAFGIINRLKERLAEQQAHEEGANSNVRALVVNLTGETESFMDNRYSENRRGTSRSYYSPQAYSAGVRAADGVSISPGSRQVGGERKQLT